MGFQTEALEDRIVELTKEVEALRRALKSHGEIVEMNAKLKKDLEDYKARLKLTDEAFSSLYRAASPQINK